MSDMKIDYSYTRFNAVKRIFRAAASDLLVIKKAHGNCCLSFIGRQSNFRFYWTIFAFSPLLFACSFRLWRE